MTVNIYDFDGTIYNGDCSVDFFLFCLKKRYKPILSVPRIATAFVFYFIGMYDKTKLKEVFFSFLSYIDDIDIVLDSFCAQYSSKLSSWYLNQLCTSDIVISASPEFLVTALMRKTVVQTVIASRIDLKSGKFTGTNCYGEEKVKRLKVFCQEITISSFYSDSLSDLPLALLAENAYLVKKQVVTSWPFTR